MFTDICITIWKYINIFFPLLLTLNVPLQIDKCPPSGTCTLGWETLC